MFDRDKLERALRVIEAKQKQKLQGLVKPLCVAFRGPQMKVHVAKLNKIKDDNIKKEKEKKEKKLKKEA